GAPGRRAGRETSDQSLPEAVPRNAVNAACVSAAGTDTAQHPAPTPEANPIARALSTSCPEQHPRISATALRSPPALRSISGRIVQSTNAGQQPFGYAAG